MLSHPEASRIQPYPTVVDFISQIPSITGHGFWLHHFMTCEVYGEHAGSRNWRVFSQPSGCHQELPVRAPATEEGPNACPARPRITNNVGIITVRGPVTKMSHLLACWPLRLFQKTTTMESHIFFFGKPCMDLWHLWIIDDYWIGNGDHD